MSTVKRYTIDRSMLYHMISFAPIQTESAQFVLRMACENPNLRL